MAKGYQLPRPVMSPGAGFHAHKARTQPGKEHQNLRPPQLTAADDRAFSIHSVNLEDILGQIEADDGRLVHGWLPSGECFHRPTLAQRDAAGGAIHTINGEWTVARRYMSLETLARVTDNPNVRLPAVAS